MQSPRKSWVSMYQIENRLFQPESERWFVSANGTRPCAPLLPVARPVRARVVGLGRGCCRRQRRRGRTTGPARPRSSSARAGCLHPSRGSRSCRCRSSAGDRRHGRRRSSRRFAQSRPRRRWRWSPASGRRTSRSRRSPCSGRSRSSFRRTRCSPRQGRRRCRTPTARSVRAFEQVKPPGGVAVAGFDQVAPASELTSMPASELTRPSYHDVA